VIYWNYSDHQTRLHVFCGNFANKTINVTRYRIHVAEQQKAGKQGRDDSIKLFFCLQQLAGLAGIWL